MGFSWLHDQHIDAPRILPRFNTLSIRSVSCMGITCPRINTHLQHCCLYPEMELFFDTLSYPLYNLYIVDIGVSTILMLRSAGKITEVIDGI